MSEDYLIDNTDLEVGDTVEVIKHPRYGVLTGATVGERFGVCEILGGREHIKASALDPMSLLWGQSPGVMHVNWFRKVPRQASPAGRG